MLAKWGESGSRAATLAHVQSEAGSSLQGEEMHSTSVQDPGARAGVSVREGSQEWACWASRHWAAGTAVWPGQESRGALGIRTNSSS